MIRYKMLSRKIFKYGRNYCTKVPESEVKTFGLKMDVMTIKYELQKLNSTMDSINQRKKSADKLAIYVLSGLIGMLSYIYYNGK